MVQKKEVEMAPSEDALPIGIRCLYDDHIGRA